MDRRTLLALVLIFLILTGYPVIMQKFFPGVMPSPKSGAGSDSTLTAQTDTATVMQDVGLDTGSTPAAATAAAEPAATGGLPGEAPADPLAVVTDAAPRDIVVRTPLYEMTISTRGGRILSWKGLEFPSWQGGVVNLVPEHIPPRGVDMVQFRAADLDLGATIFAADRQELDLRQGGGAAGLTLTVRLAGDLEVRKVFTFHPDTYDFQVDMVVAATGPGAQATLARVGAPQVIRTGWNQGIAPTERIQKLEHQSMRSMAKVGEELEFKKLSGLAKSEDKVTGQWRGSVQFAGLQNRYFTIVGMVPREQGGPVEGTIRLGGDQETGTQSWSIDLPARRGVGDEIATARLDYYIGPQEASLLQSYGMGLEKTMDLGWKLFRPLTEFVLWGMYLMHNIIPNYGVIIIIFSVLTKLMFYPLTKTSTRSMKKMQEIQPKLKALQEKYKDDKEKLNQATMQLYKDEKVNPMAGCLPLLVQSPVFIALYQGLSHTISLRGQPFALWITDLSQPDAIMTMPFSLPFLGSDLNVLPLLMAVAMYFQTKLTPTSGAGGQMAAMNTMMPLFMVFIFYNMPSGLVLYWLVNTILQAYQTWQIHREAAGSEGAQTA